MLSGICQYHCIKKGLDKHRRQNCTYNTATVILAENFQKSEQSVGLGGQISEVGLKRTKHQS